MKMWRLTMLNIREQISSPYRAIYNEILVKYQAATPSAIYG